jgi:hypothetical protein
MELILGSETSTHLIQTPGLHPKEYTLFNTCVLYKLFNTCVLYKLFNSCVLYKLFNTCVLYKLFNTCVLYKLFKKYCSIVPRNPASTNSIGSLDVRETNILHWFWVKRFWLLYRIRHFI